ncbi:phosphotransferase [Phenylobacterium sp.]|uniref:phosphotransferase n=1 Tax=Phenylobacterium sp. TaxID=1871053 RepID=UPI0035B0CA70
MLQAIPEPKRAAVARALTAAFGTDEPDALTPLSGGLSGGEVYRLRVGGIAYVLRIEAPADGFRDPARAYACMNAAAGACLAPAVRYACAADGVAIMDFVPERSLALDYAGSKAELMTELGQAVRVLHETPGFPPLMDYLDGMDLLIGQFRAQAADSAAEEALARYGEIAAAYRRLPADPVSSHNDLNPRNVIYDGRRLWLIDWESAFRADRYVDLAAMTGFFAADEAEAEAGLRAYFRRPPVAAERARLFLARQIGHVFYGIMFLGGALAERPGEAPPDGARALGELHAAIGLGEPVLERWEGRAAYGQARFAAMLEALDGPGLPAALAAL